MEFPMYRRGDGRPSVSPVSVPIHPRMWYGCSLCHMRFFENKSSLEWHQLNDHRIISAAVTAPTSFGSDAAAAVMGNITTNNNDNEDAVREIEFYNHKKAGISSSIMSYSMDSHLPEVSTSESAVVMPSCCWKKWAVEHETLINNFVLSLLEQGQGQGSVVFDFVPNYASPDFSYPSSVLSELDQNGNRRTCVCCSIGIGRDKDNLGSENETVETAYTPHSSHQINFDSNQNNTATLDSLSLNMLDDVNVVVSHGCEHMPLNNAVEGASTEMAIITSEQRETTADSEVPIDHDTVLEEGLDEIANVRENGDGNLNGLNEIPIFSENGDNTQNGSNEIGNINENGDGHPSKLNEIAIFRENGDCNQEGLELGTVETVEIADVNNVTDPDTDPDALNINLLLPTDTCDLSSSNIEVETESEETIKIVSVSSLVQPADADNDEGTLPVRIPPKYYELSEILSMSKQSESGDHCYYECGVCQKVTKSKYAFDKHIPTHLANRRFKCQICCSGYTTCHNLKLHMQAQHKIQTPSSEKVKASSTRAAVHAFKSVDVEKVDSSLVEPKGELETVIDSRKRRVSPRKATEFSNSKNLTPIASKDEETASKKFKKSV